MEKCNRPEVSNKSSQYIKATNPQNSGKKPNVTKGGDLRSK